LGVLGELLGIRMHRVCKALEVEGRALDFGADVQDEILVLGRVRLQLVLEGLGMRVVLLTEGGDQVR
jgi:hypothetical protein